MWLSTEILNWDVTPEDFGSPHENFSERAYALWKHAEQVLIEYNEPLYLVDVITTLKRAINHRLQYLNNLYQFKKIPNRNKSHGLLEQLADVGIVKPIMLKRLMMIRNEIEHQDVPPPSKDRCEEFLEFSWYFLRSTDKQSTQLLENFNYRSEYNENYPPYWILVTTGPQNDWVIKLKGWVQPSMVSMQEKKSWLDIKVENTMNRTVFMQEHSDNLSSVDGYGKNPDDIWFFGTLVAPQKYRDHLYKIYFSLL